MAILHTQINTRSPEFAANSAAMLEQVNNLSLLIGEDLNFNMPWTLKILFQHHFFIAETSTSFPPRRFQLQVETIPVSGNLQTLTTAAGHGLDHYRKTNQLGLL